VTIDPKPETNKKVGGRENQKKKPIRNQSFHEPQKFKAKKSSKSSEEKGKGGV